MRGLDGLTDRTIELLASMIAGVPVRVVRAQSLVHPLNVVLRSRSLFLNPLQAGLYDVCLGAVLLRHRGELAERNGNLRDDRIADILRLANDEVAALGPRARGLPGSSEEPRICWSDAEWRPPSPEAIASGRGMISLPGLGPGGMSAMDAVARALKSGKLATETLPDLPELPFARASVDLKVAPEHPGNWEAMREDMAQLDRHVREWVRCHLQRAESAEKEHESRWVSQGVSVDGSRLAPGLAAARAGLPARIFRRRARSAALYRPEEHLAVLAFDVASLSEERPSLSEKVIYVTVRVFQELGADAVVMAFTDRKVRRPDGRTVYLHIPIVVKKLEEDYDGAFWSRVSHLLHVERWKDAASYPALQMRSALGELSKVARRKDYQRLEVLLFSTGDVAGVGGPGFHARIANSMDDAVRGAKDEYPGDWSVSGMVSERIQSAARPGGTVARMQKV